MGYETGVAGPVILSLSKDAGSIPVGRLGHWMDRFAFQPTLCASLKYGSSQCAEAPVLTLTTYDGT
jgi:hypothetical protein